MCVWYNIPNIVFDSIAFAPLLTLDEKIIVDLIYCIL